MNKTILAHSIHQKTANCPTLVLLHGFCESKNIWKSFAKELGNEFQVICIDLPGFGESPRWITPYTIEDMAVAVHQTLQHLHIERCVMVGHSLGGYVTLAYAAQYLQHLKGICLFNSLIYGDTEEKKQDRNKWVESLQTYGTAPFLKTFFHNLMADYGKKNLSAAADKLAAEAQSIHIDTLIFSMQAMRDRKDQTELIRNLTIPLCYVIGLDDPVINGEQNVGQTQVKTKNRIITNKFYFIGHLAMIESEGLSMQAVGDFTAYCFMEKVKEVR